jgi:MoaA/NifB/PqqE/SkfB family radical SAM enzyme
MMKFNKFFKCDEYEIFFNTFTGLEIMRGTNGKEDPFSLHLPSLLDVGIMGHCKHSCSFCYQGHESEANMKLDDFKTIIDQVSHHVNQVALGGRGDPNHHRNFGKILEYCRKNGVVPNYTTSGIDLTDEHIELSKMCGAVAVSDYGQDYTYDALQRFMDADIKTNIHMIFSQTSYDSAIKILYGYDPWQKQGKSRVDIDRLNAVIFLLFKAAGAGTNLEWKPKNHQIQAFADLVFKPEAKFKIGMDSCLVNHVLNFVEPDEIQRMSIDSCEGARMSAYITPDMQMMPCSFADKDRWAIPITPKKDINTIWNRSKSFQSFRKILKQNQCCCPLGL